MLKVILDMLMTKKNVRHPHRFLIKKDTIPKSV